MTFRQSYFANIYRELSNSRSYDQGMPMAIPVSEMLGYGQGFGMCDPDELAELILYIQSMDQAYREKQFAKAQKSGDLESLRKSAGVSK